MMFSQSQKIVLLKHQNLAFFKELKNVKFQIFTIFALLLLLYMLWPAPSYVEDFSPLPKSLKSKEPGDTVQVPNIAAYFSENFRNSVIPYYKNEYQNLSRLPFPPLKLNHPPEFAYTAIRDQTPSTYLEELVYPLRDSLFINGFEPFYEDGRPKYKGATDIVVDDIFFKSKTIIRFYPSPAWAKFITWFGITLSLILLWKLSKKII